MGPSCKGETFTRRGNDTKYFHLIANEKHRKKNKNLVGTR
jgi:hypothetical protein